MNKTMRFTALPWCCLICKVLSVFNERRYFTVISRISAFSILEYLDTCWKRQKIRILKPNNDLFFNVNFLMLTSFFIASNTRVFNSFRLSLILARRIFSISGFLDCKAKQTFLLINYCNFSRKE